MGYFTRLILRWVYMFLIYLGIAQENDLNLILNDPDLVFWTNTALGFIMMVLTEGWYIFREKVYRLWRTLNDYISSKSN